MCRFREGHVIIGLTSPITSTAPPDPNDLVVSEASIPPTQHRIDPNGWGQENRWRHDEHGHEDDEHVA